jgi:hypothetical protein
MNPLSGVVAEAWQMYRAHAKHLLTIAFVIYVVAAAVEALLTGLLGVVGALLAGVVAIIAAFLLQAALVKAVEDVRDGRADLSLGDTVRAAQPFVGRVAGASILAGIGIGIGFILLIVPGLFLLTIWCLIVPVIVLEGAGVFAAFTRSRQLVRPHAWQVFGTIVLVFLLLIVASIVISLVLVALPQAVRGAISGIVSGTLVSPFTALVLTMGYFRLRSASEGTGGGPPERQYGAPV